MSSIGPLPPIENQPFPGDSGSSQNALLFSLDTIEQINTSLQISVSNQAISLTPGRISLIELTALINKEIKGLRSAIIKAEMLDPDLWKRYHQAIVDAALELENLYTDLQQTLTSWTTVLAGGSTLVNVTYPNLVNTYSDFNTFMQQTWQSDRTAIQDLNALYQDYNTLTPLRIQQIYNSLTPQEQADLIAGLTPAQITALGGTQNATVIQWFNAQIAAFNNYASTRPDVQAEIDALVGATNAYNAQVTAQNQAITQVNIQRAQYGLAPYPLYTPAPIPSSTPLYLTLPQQPLITTPIPPSLADLRTPLTVPVVADQGTVTNPPSPGVAIVVSPVELITSFFVPILTISLAIMTVSNDLIALSAEFAETQAVTANTPGIKNFVAPFGLFQKVGDVPIADLSSAGGAGLASFSLGLHSRVLETVLSHAILQTVAEDASLPISERFFASLQFSVLEILSKSSILSSAPAVRSMAARLGSIGADSPVISAGIALAFGDQVTALVNSSVIRELVNGQVSGLAFYARTQHREALAGVAKGEAALKEALASKDPTLLEGAVAYLAKTRTALAETTRLFNAFGGASFGQLAASANGLSAALNLSLLSVSTALYARALGIPELAPALFSQSSEGASSASLAALGSGSSIVSILDNPINMVYIKQTLVDQLINKYGVDAAAAQALISGAINGTISAGANINTLGGLQEVLLSEFLGKGSGLLQANRLANDTTALIRGDLGNIYLHTAFGLNVDPSLIASSTANALFGTDVGLAGSMLSSAVVHSLLYGGFGTQVRLESELKESFQGLGTIRGDAQEIASQTRSFIETLGMAVPLSQFPGLADVLMGDTLLSKIAFGEGIVRKEMLTDLQVRGLSNTQAEFVTDQLSALVNGSFVPPSESALLELAIKNGIERALAQGDTFETQRDFRDSLAGELRAVGFGGQDALYLANNVASSGINGANASIYGASPARVEAIMNSLESSLPKAVVEDALNRAKGKAPFATEDEFRNVLREEIYSAHLNATGRSDGHTLFDQAIGGLVDGSRISLEALVGRVSSQARALFNDDLGEKLAGETKDRILHSLLGGTSLKQIEDVEKRNPLSVLNQVENQIKHLTKEEEIADLKSMLKKLQQLLEALTTPNAQLGFVLTSLTDNPGTFFNAANSSVGSDNFQATQIVV